MRRAMGGRSCEIRPESKKMVLCHRVVTQIWKRMGPGFSQDNQESRHQKEGSAQDVSC